MIHQTSVGTYHPAPGSCPAWTVHDTRGYTDGGPACDGEGCPEPCECEAHCENCGSGCDYDSDLALCTPCATDGENPEPVCIGLSFAYVCLDGGEALCPECAEKEGVKVTECDCP